MPDINGIPYVESDDLVSAYPSVSQSLAQEVSDQLAAKLPYSYGTATPSTTDDGFLWYDENDTPPTPKFWDGAAFQNVAPAGGLELIATVSIGSAVSSVTVNNCFSSTYTNYRIVISEATGSGSNQLRIKFPGLTSSNYNSRGLQVSTSAATAEGDTTASQWVVGYVDVGTANGVSIDIYAPAIAGNRIGFSAIGNGKDRSYLYAGQYSTNGSATGMTLDTNTGTISGGEIRIYGYKD